MMMTVRKSSVVVHTPRNVDLPPHVVMVRGSEEEALYMSSENGEQKPVVSYPRKRCFCLCAWLFGLILLCIGVFIIVHYLLVDTGDNITNNYSSSKINNNKKFSVLFHNFDISKVCNDSLESSLTIEKKVALSDYVVVGNIMIQPDIKRSLSSYEEGSPAAPFLVDIDTASSLLKGSLSEMSHYNVLNQQIVLDLGYDNKCRGSFSIAATSNQPHVLFFISDSKLYDYKKKGSSSSSSIIPLFHPLSSSEKLVHIIRRIAEEDVTRLTGTNIQPSLDRLEIDSPLQSTPDFSSTLPDVSAVKLNGIEPGRQKFSLYLVKM